MKNFVTVLQTSATKFDVQFFNAESESRLFPQTSKIGVVVHVMESNPQNDKFAFELADRMNNN